MSQRPVNPLEHLSDPQALRRALISLSRLGRALVELIALSCDEVSATPLQRATRELNITPRMAHEYQLGDVQAELEELAETGWLIDMGGVYRCPPELGGAINDLMSPQSIRDYKRQVMKLNPSALLQAIRAQSLEGDGSLLMYTLRVGRQLQRDLLIADKLGDISGFFAILWSAFESELLPRLWVAQCLRGLDPALIRRLPAPLSLWVSAELALVHLYQRPEVQLSDPTPLTTLSEQLQVVREGLNGRGEGTRDQFTWLSDELLSFLKRERGLTGRHRPQVRSALQTCLETVCEALILSDLLTGDSYRAPERLEALSATLEALRADRSLRHELGRRLVDPTGRLRLWSCLAHLTRGEVSSAQCVWSEGVRAFNRQSVGRLLGADAQLTRRVSALCLYALKPPTPNPLRLPSTAHHHIEIEDEGAYIDELITLLAQPAQGITPIRQNALKQLCASPLSPLWELVSLTALAWAGITDDELNGHAEVLASRVTSWRDAGYGLISDAITCLHSSAPPTHLSGLKEPSPEWLQRLERLERLAALLVEAHNRAAEPTWSH